MKTSDTLALIAALIPWSPRLQVTGQDNSGYSGASFDTLDTNRDGKISQAEAGADATIVFTSADANGDGYLDKSEWKNRTKGSTSPAPQSAPQGDQPASEPMPDTETPRQ